MSNQYKFDLEQMKKRCLDPFEAFVPLGVQVGDKEGDRYIYIDRGASILAVAHLDSVIGLDHFASFKVADDWHVFNGQLDDRLGAYMILDYLPKLGVECDVLLTEGEETGQSTAALFTPPEGKVYDWMFSFDRTGTDVVMYQYKTHNLVELLKDCGFHIGIGSFSDICWLDHLGCAGLNFGVGYYDYHGPLAYCNLSDTVRSVYKFLKFYRETKGVRFPYDPKSGGYRKPRHKQGGYYDSYYDYPKPSAPKQLTAAYEKDSYYTDRDVTEEELEEEGQARQRAIQDGIDLDKQIQCSVCRYSVTDAAYYFRYDMCKYCYQEMLRDAGYGYGMRPSGEG